MLALLKSKSGCVGVVDIGDGYVFGDNVDGRDAPIEWIGRKPRRPISKMWIIDEQARCGMYILSEVI